MKTDIVVVEEPKIIQSYNDLLGHRVKLLFPNVVSISDRFEFAEPNSKERILWQESLEEFEGNRSAMVSLINLNFNSMFRIMEQLAFSKVQTVLMIPEYFVKFLRVGVCHFKILAMHQSTYQRHEEIKNIFTWISSDLHSKENMMSLVHSAHYKSPYLKMVYQRTSWAMAMGFPKMTFLLLGKPLNMIKIYTQKELNALSHCLADNYRDNLPPSSHSAFSLIQFRSLLICCAVLICFAFVCLFQEFHKKATANFLRRQRRQKTEVAHLIKMYQKKSNEPFNLWNNKYGKTCIYY